MNNYKFLEKVFHKIMLSQQFIREATFDLESTFFPQKSVPYNSVFIVGLARSGTTILLNAFYESRIFASLTYADMPFILAPNLWSKIYKKKDKYLLKERAHGDGIKISIDSPEAFEEVFWNTFPENEHESLDKFEIFMNNILFKYKKNRYLSKNNQNMKRISIISEFLPHSKILIPFRDPIQNAFSLLTQHNKFFNLSKKDSFISEYMKLIGHTEFGPNYVPIKKDNLKYTNHFDINHWIEQWYKIYSNCLEIFLNKNNVFLIDYQKLCTQDDYWLEILKILDIEEPYKFKFKESKKEINLQIDATLKNKALSLFEKLKNNI